jgi:hypothetical protein
MLKHTGKRCSLRIAAAGAAKKREAESKKLKAEIRGARFALRRKMGMLKHTGKTCSLRIAAACAAEKRKAGKVLSEKLKFRVLAARWGGWRGVSMRKRGSGVGGAGQVCLPGGLARGFAKEEFGVGEE